jgi:hypothetical protein
MKTTMIFRPIANPRRTRLAALKDAEPQNQTEPTAEAAEQAEQAQGRPLPQRTANPRRTVLNEPPAGAALPE